MELSETARTGILMIVGFGDKASIFEGLGATTLAQLVASVIASLALRKNSPLEMILSVEGNITADDACSSKTQRPGEVLIPSGKVPYLYDDPNCPEGLQSHDVGTRRHVGASHWPGIDAPDILSAQCGRAITDPEQCFRVSIT